MSPMNLNLVAQDGHAFAAYEAKPTGKPKGGIVIAQEIFGVNSHIRSVVDGYAADGYHVIAPALFDRDTRHYETGYSPDDIAAGRAVIGRLDWANTMKDVAATVEHLRTAGRVAVIGYCWGGTIAWLAAARLSTVAAAVGYYGGGIPDFLDEAPKQPLLLHFGEKDPRPSPECAATINSRYPAVKTFIYPAGHGFNCDQRGSYDAASATLARARTLAFLADPT